MGTNICCQSSSGEKFDIQYDSNKESLSESGGLIKKPNKSFTVTKPPFFSIHPSLNKGKALTTKGKSKQVSNTTLSRVNRADLLLGGGKRSRMKSGSTRASNFPENMREKSFTITNKVKRASNLKVNPRCFRVEKSGKVEDNYEMLEVIGKGGYGEVRKIRDLRTKEIKAVKVIAKNRCQTTSSFSDEISILQELVLQSHYSRITRTW